MRFAGVDHEKKKRATLDGDLILPGGWLREKILFGQKLHVGRELVLRIKGGIDPDGVGVEFPHASRKAKNQKRPLGLLDSTDHLNFSCSGDCALWKADDH